MDSRNCKDGQYVRMAGCVIARQRPGIAKGFIFLSMEDETGIANVIITPHLFERERLLITTCNLFWWKDRTRLQNLAVHKLEMRSHDFH
jgi:error-prone DNA polymerase